MGPGSDDGVIREMDVVEGWFTVAWDTNPDAWPTKIV